MENPKRTTAKPKPWHSYLTLDLVLQILQTSIFHPFIVLVFYLSIAALHKHRTPLAAYTLYYAAFLIELEVLLWANRRLTYGAARKVSWENEVVVLTGGATGLGRCLLQMLAQRGVSVAVLDVAKPDGEVVESLVGNGGCVAWYECDVGDEMAVGEVAHRIRKELGTPTILINNAATPINGKPLFASHSAGSPNLTEALSANAIKRTVNVNFLGHANTLHAFVGDISSNPNGGTVVTVSSILAQLAPAHLADYAASKAAVSSLHHTLTNEIRQARLSGKVKTVLVEVGQMATDLFEKVETPWYAQFVGPTLEVTDVAKEIVRQLDRGQGAIVRMPAYARVMAWYGVMPGSLQRVVRWFGGIDEALTGGKFKEMRA